MKKHIEYKTHGTCSTMIILDLDGDTIESCQFIRGCHGNTQGVAALVRGMKIEDAIERLQGIRCGMKSTSCPDQLAEALKSALVEA